jgi:hypothetical protein
LGHVDKATIRVFFLILPLVFRRVYDN